MTVLAAAFLGDRRGRRSGTRLCVDLNRAVAVQDGQPDSL
jgi:hypothetical protein